MRPLGASPRPAAWGEAPDGPDAGPKGPADEAEVRGCGNRCAAAGAHGGPAGAPDGRTTELTERTEPRADRHASTARLAPRRVTLEIYSQYRKRTTTKTMTANMPTPVARIIHVHSDRSARGLLRVGSRFIDEPNCLARRIRNTAVPPTKKIGNHLSKSMTYDARSGSRYVPWSMRPMMPSAKARASLASILPESFMRLMRSLRASFMSAGL